MQTVLLESILFDCCLTSYSAIFQLYGDRWQRILTCCKAPTPWAARGLLRAEVTPDTLTSLPSEMMVRRESNPDLTVQPAVCPFNPLLSLIHYYFQYLNFQQISKSSYFNKVRL